LSVAVVFALAHVGVLAFAWVATLPRPDAGDRILLPLLPAGIAFLIFLVDSAAELGRTGRALRTMILAGAAVALATWLPVTVRLAAQLHAEGEGYTSVQWRSSPTLQAVLEIPLDVPIISNEASPILFYADHPAYEITELNQQQRLAGYPRYGEGPGDRAQRAFREEGGRLVLFHSAYWNFYPIYEADTSARLEALVDGLDVLGSYADGDIYSYPSSEGATTSLAVKPATSAWAAGGDDCVLHSYLGERRGGESERRSWTPSPAQCEGRQGRTHAE